MKIVTGRAVTGMASLECCPRGTASLGFYAGGAL